MKTFRRYLLSYLLTLFLPVGILSIVISQIVLHYCANQLLDNNAAVLRQLDTSVSMQVTQFNAYAIQTTQRTEFSRRKLEKAGGFYDAQRTLLQWQITNTLMDNVYFFNTEDDPVYAYNMVNSGEKVYRYRLAAAGFNKEKVMQLLDGNAESPWLAAQNDRRSALLYAAYARIDTATQNGLLFSIDTDALQALMDGAAVYVSAATYLCDSAGNIIYTADPLNDAIRSQVQYLISMPEDRGLATLEGKTVLYARLAAPEHGLIFLNTVPQQVAYAPLSRLWGMFFAGLLVIFALGGTMIALVMRVNYIPIRNREKDVMAADVLSDPTDDAVLNVRKALRAIQQNNSAITQRSVALSKERLILRLLLGRYDTKEAFNADGEALSLRLCGDAWRILITRGTGSSCEEEDFALRLVQAIRSLMDGEQMQLYLEVPENHMVIFIIAGDAVASTKYVETALHEQGLDVQADMSRCCDGTVQLANAWVQIMQPVRNNDAASTAAVSEFCEALRNALEFGEAERILFAMESLRNMLNAELDRTDAAQLCNDVLYLVRRWMEQHEDKAGVQSIRALAQAFIVSSLPPRDASNQLLDQVMELLAPRLTPQEQEENNLIQCIENYLSENYRDADFTVQRAADHFQLSISNLSHYFKNHVGVSVSEYVEQLRMHAAQEMLTSTDCSVGQIANEIGYAQPATFMRAFKKVCGMSPTAYRNMAQEQMLHGNS